MTKTQKEKKEKVTKTKKTRKKVENKKNEKKEPLKINKLIIVLIILLLIALILKVTIKPAKKDKTNEEPKEEMIVNERKEVIKKQEKDGLTFSGVSLVTQNNETYITLEVTNNSGADYKLDEVHIFLKTKNDKNIIEYVDEDGNIINYLIGYVGDTLKANESRTIVSNIDTNITDKVYTIDYEIIK